MPDSGERLRQMIRRRAVTPAPVGLDGNALLRWRLEVVEAGVAEIHASVRKLYWVVIGAVVLGFVSGVFGG